MNAFQSNTWYPVVVRSGREFTAESLLVQKGYDVFVPKYRSWARVGGRLVERETALFPSYLFCRFAAPVNGSILTTPHVRSFVCCGRVPLAVDADEVRMLQMAVAESSVEPHPFIRVGQRARVTSGALTGLEGIVVRVRNRFRLVMSITLLQRAAAIEIDSVAVSPIRDQAPALVWDCRSHA